MTTDPALRARLRWLSDEAPKLWWQPENRGDTSKSAHLEVRAIADDALATLAAAEAAPRWDAKRLAKAIRQVEVTRAQREGYVYEGPESTWFDTYAEDIGEQYDLLEDHG
jgi:hypothetical protein